MGNTLKSDVDTYSKEKYERIELELKTKINTLINDVEIKGVILRNYTVFYLFHPFASLGS